MGTPYIRAMVTIDHLHDELCKEREARKAMELCYEKVQSILDNRFQGHLIDRIRFHLKHHRDVYLRKVRHLKLAEKKDEKHKATQRRSLRVQNASELEKEVLKMKKILAEREEEIERLCKLVDSRLPGQ
jgi:hypothetical protein